MPGHADTGPARAWPCERAAVWHRLPANRDSPGQGFDCCWAEQGRINNFFLERHRGSLRNVSILPASILDARVGSRLNASRMLVVHHAGCANGGRPADKCAAELYNSAARSGLERASVFGF